MHKILTFKCGHEIDVRSKRELEKYEAYLLSNLDPCANPGDLNCCCGFCNELSKESGLEPGKEKDLAARIAFAKERNIDWSKWRLGKKEAIKQLKLNQGE